MQARAGLLEVFFFFRLLFHEGGNEMIEIQVAKNCVTRMIFVMRLQTRARPAWWLTTSRYCYCYIDTFAYAY